MRIHERPILTDLIEDLDSFIPERDSAYIFAVSAEERSSYGTSLPSHSVDVQFVEVTTQGPTSFNATIEGQSVETPLRSSASLSVFWDRIARRTVYIDITGLDHRVWAPLLKTGLAAGLRIIVVYVEPNDYRFNPSPREGDIFDLSDRIQGISPLPGFAVLDESGNSNFEFVALLGFEGVRFKYMIEQVQPAQDRITPIFGAPGFRAEYPFFAFEGNRPVLEETMAWSRARYARANCPFSLYYVLDDIAKQAPRASIKIGLIGTKPHAVGAVLFSILSGRSVELIYDNPIRKPKRTVGTARVLLYHVSSLSLSTSGA